MGTKTFEEKLHESKNLPKIVELEDAAAIARYGGRKMLVAPPLAYYELIKKIPAGTLITTDRIRQYLARESGADFTCPLTAGLFINICAKAAAERKTTEIPYWRVLKKDGELNEKFPGGIDGHRIHLENEGHEVIQKGKKYFVKNFEQKMLTL